jgi:DNA-binding transcriptional MerR regulator
MMTISHTPIYNLGAMLKETGLQADVLRAWERRYGLPQPHRTKGGHRLYSDHDLAIVKWLRARQSEGLSISRAAALWKDLSKSGHDPLSEEIEDKPAGKPLLLVENNRVDIFKSTWLEACMAFDMIKAEDIVNQAFAIFPVETVCLEIFQKGISEIGDLWYQNKASVQQEHFTSALAIRRIESLITSTSNPIRVQTLIAGCPSGEEHTFPVLLLTLLLRRKGINVIYLGADIPLEQLEHTAASIHPTLIVLAAQRLNTAAGVLSTAQLAQNLGIPLAYGGHIFSHLPALRSRIPGYFLGEKLDEAVDIIENLVIKPEVFPHSIHQEESYLETTRAFNSKRSSIEAEVLTALKESNLFNEYMVVVNAFFTSELQAALELGDLDFMAFDFRWLEKLLADRKMTKKNLSPYLTLYQQVIRKHLEKAGALIIEWITSYLTKE